MFEISEREAEKLYNEAFNTESELFKAKSKAMSLKPCIDGSTVHNWNEHRITEDVAYTICKRCGNRLSPNYKND